MLETLALASTISKAAGVLSLELDTHGMVGCRGSVPPLEGCFRSLPPIVTNLESNLVSKNECRCDDLSDTQFHPTESPIQSKAHVLQSLPFRTLVDSYIKKCQKQRLSIQVQQQKNTKSHSVSYGSYSPWFVGMMKTPFMGIPINQSV